MSSLVSIPYSFAMSSRSDPANLAPATEIKAKIQAFKTERIGGRRKDFVKTLASSDPMNLDQG